MNLSRRRHPLGRQASFRGIDDLVGGIDPAIPERSEAVRAVERGRRPGNLGFRGGNSASRVSVRDVIQSRLLPAGVPSSR